ncbi:MAG: hypothetical protein ACKV2T_23840 [Kofleriaceae bacterium]
MFRVVIACALVAGCGDEIASKELPACGNLADGHWDSRLLSPGVAGGFNPSVASLAKMPDGSIVAGGSFQTMSGVVAKNIARWDGARWHALGEGLPGLVMSVTVDDRGQLWAAGDHGGTDKLDGGGFGGSYVVRWTGAEWISVVEYAYTIRGITPVDGGVAVFGSFFADNMIPTAALGIWRDGVWSGTNLGNGSDVMTAHRDGTGVCASGVLSTTQDKTIAGVACWNGTAWTQLGDSIDSVLSLARDKNGGWYAGGYFRLFEEGNDRYGIARLEDGVWRGLDGGVFPHEPGLGGGEVFQPYVTSISLDGDDLVIAGRFVYVGVPKRRAYHLARWNPTTGWSAMTPPSDLFGRLATVLATDAHTYVGGSFPRIGIEAGAGIASVDAGDVRALPAATHALAKLGSISDMAVLSDGLLLAGQFRSLAEVGQPVTTAQTLLHFDGDWRSIEGIPNEGAMVAASLGDEGYAVRSGDKLYRRLSGDRWKIVTNRPVRGPIVADGSGTLYFVLPTQPESTIVQTSRGDTSFFATVPGEVLAMAIYDGTLVVATNNPMLGGHTIYRRHDGAWELLGAWSDVTVNLVVSPALGLVAATTGGLRVWNGSEWRTVSRATIYGLAACSDGVVASIDEGDGGRLAFLDDPDDDWTYYGAPRGGQWWQVAPSERGIYVSAAFAGEGGVDSQLGFTRWTTLDDSGW